MTTLKKDNELLASLVAMTTAKKYHSMNQLIHEAADHLGMPQNTIRFKVYKREWQGKLGFEMTRKKPQPKRVEHVESHINYRQLHAMMPVQEISYNG